MQKFKKRVSHTPSWKITEGYPLVALTVKNLPIMQETQVWPLGWKDLLEEEMATHSSILAWRIPGPEEPS